MAARTAKPGKGEETDHGTLLMGANFDFYRTWSNEGPDPHCVRVMEKIDAMPRRWRDLVREYGYAKVIEMYEGGMPDPDAAEMALYQQRMQIEVARGTAAPIFKSPEQFMGDGRIKSRVPPAGGRR